MDDSFDSLDSDDEINLESIQYKPKPKEKPKEKVKEKVVKKDVKPVEKQLVKRAKSKTMKEMPSEEEVMNKRKIILLLEFYKIEFPDELKAYKKLNLHKKSFDELSDLKSEMDFILGNNSGIASAVKLFRIGIHTLEVLAVNFTPINCKGLSSICNDPDVIKDIKLIALKNSKLIQTEPEYRLAYKIITTALALHNINPSIQYDIPNEVPLKSQNEDNIKNINSQYMEI